MERGFKTWAENLAEGLRRELGVASIAPIELVALARSLGVKLLTPRDVPGLRKDVLNQLLIHDRSGWSAATVSRNGVPLVIYNPTHSAGRRSSDIAHELAHLILDHEPGTIVLSQDATIVMRSFDATQEDEANWLGWCILLPRKALENCARLRLSVEEIAGKYGTSETLARFRIRMTGVARQYKSAARITGSVGVSPTRAGIGGADERKKSVS